MTPQNKIAIIADDLTGANDAGVQFANLGLGTIVLMGADNNIAGIEETVVVVDTNSRALAPDQAYKKAAEAAALFRGGQFRTIYKKIDSTLRGNPGSEIDAIMDTCGQEIAIVAPAFPKNGRVTIGGYQLVHGVPLEATEFAKDPKCPVTQSHLPTLLAAQSKRKVGHLGMKAFLNGDKSVMNSIEELVASGNEIIVCDVWHENQFNAIVAAATALNKSILWAGSAGLAAFLVPDSGSHTTTISDGGPVAVIAGSVSNVTRGQIEKLKERRNISIIEADPCALLQPESSAAEIGRCFVAASGVLAEGKDIVITLGSGDEAVEKTKQLGNSNGFSGRRTTEIVAAGLGELCKKMVLNLNLNGLVLTGGDIALSCCSALSASGLRVHKEVSPGIPMGSLRGGPFDGLRVVTKAGAFGAEDALCRAIDCLKQRMQGER